MSGTFLGRIGAAGVLCDPMARSQVTPERRELDGRKSLHRSVATASGRRRAPKRSQVLAQKIVDKICGAQMVAGDRLPPEQKLMTEYGVGRATYREAVRLLESNGVVVVQPGPGGGPMVSGSGATHLAGAARLQLQLCGATYGDVARARVALEPFMARLTAERRDSYAIAVLRQIEADAALVDLDDRVAVCLLIQRFHTALGSGSGNTVIDLLGSLLTEVQQPVTSQIYLSHSATTAQFDGWTAIVEAIAAGRASDAEHRVREMLTRNTDDFLDRYPDLAAEPVTWT